MERVSWLLVAGCWFLVLVHLPSSSPSPSPSPSNEYQD